MIGNYPFDSYAAAIVADPVLYYALETQTVSTFPFGADSEDFVAHELAHQWFGNSASVKRWEDLWIAEGTATYFEVLWLNRDDPAAFDAEMLAHLRRYRCEQCRSGRSRCAGADVHRSHLPPRRIGALRAAAEGRRPKVLCILRAFHAFYRGRNATSQDFINVAVFVSDDGSVRELLQAWLYEEPVPPLPGQAAPQAKRGPVRTDRCRRHALRGGAPSRHRLRFVRRSPSRLPAWLGFSDHADM